MMNPWRLLALAAALSVTLGVGVATAQTVIVRHAPAGATTELMVNTDRVAAATADAAGGATLSVPTASAKADMDGNVFVDLCENARRVLIVERGQAPAQLTAGCERREIPGLFWIRNITTLVVDAAGPTPTMRLKQGPAPAAWLTDDPAAVRLLTQPPTGVVLFGGAGLGSLGDPAPISCGTVSECSGDGSGPTYTGGVTYWLSPFLGVEAAYVRPPVTAANGSGTGLRFESEFDADVVTFNGKVGIPAGRVRIFGQGGTNYHRGVFSTTQTIDDVTITVDGVEQTIPGGTQTLAFETRGWGWQIGGGFEAWINRTFAIYGEAGRIVIKGGAIDDGEGETDEALLYAVAGVRLRIGR